MSRAHPTNRQRKCNCACAKDPVTATDDAGIFDLAWLQLTEPPWPTALEENANQAADRILLASIEMAKNVVGHTAQVRPQMLALATVHAQVAATVYAAQMQATAIQEAATEICGAISEAGCDIGAGLALALEQALKDFPNGKPDHD